MCFSLRCREDPAFSIFANRLFLAVARVGCFVIVVRLRRFASRVGPISVLTTHLMASKKHFGIESWFLCHV